MKTQNTPNTLRNPEKEKMEQEEIRLPDQARLQGYSQCSTVLVPKQIHTPRTG